MGHEHHHHHDHDHHRHHRHDDRSGRESAEGSGSLSEADKLIKMVEHWIQHNQEHAKSYRAWADRARQMGQDQAALILEEVAGGSLAQNQNFERILGLLKSGPSSR